MKVPSPSLSLLVITYSLCAAVAFDTPTRLRLGSKHDTGNSREKLILIFQYFLHLLEGRC